MNGCKLTYYNSFVNGNSVELIIITVSYSCCNRLLLVNLRDEGKKILERLKEPVEDVLKTLDYIDTVECVHSLYEQMNTLFDTFQKFSLEKTRKLYEN